MTKLAKLLAAATLSLAAAFGFAGAANAQTEVPTDDVALVLQPPAPTGKTVFTTSTIYNGRLGRLAGADAKCLARADAAGLGGTYKAWIASGAHGSPANRFVQATVPYVRTDGVKVADDWADLTSCTGRTCLKQPIDRDEFGNMVTGFAWSNVMPDGNLADTGGALSCRMWTNARYRAHVPLFGRVGNVASTSSTSTISAIVFPCFTGQRLYCFEQ